MKPIYLVVISLIFAGTIFARDNEKKLSSEISVSLTSGRILLPGKSNVAFTLVSPEWKNVIGQNELNMSFEMKDIKEDSVTFQGKMKTWDGAVSFHEKITANADKSVNCSWSIASDKGIDCQANYAILKLPEFLAGSQIIIDQKAIELPKIKDKCKNIEFFNNAKRVIIPMEKHKITLTGDMNGLLMVSKDHRCRYYGLRLYASPMRGVIKQSAISFNISVSEILSTPVKMNAAANSCFIDEVADDRQGGWTDQGHSTDLRAMKPGKIKLNAINFDILNSKNNNGKSCVVLKGSARDYFPNSSTINLDGEIGKKLYLLHAAAWSSKDKKAGTIKVNYADGSSDALPVVCGVDVGDWAKNKSMKNATPVWSAESDSFGEASLYLSAFPLRDKALKNVVLDSGDGPVWMITAMALSKDEVSPVYAKSKTITYRASDEWLAIDWAPMKIIPGSALDFSGTTEKPAGKYGDVYCDGEVFRFKNNPKKSVRFFGNTVFHQMPYLTKTQAEQFADELSALGYNAMRFHCYIKGMSKNDGSPDLDPKGLDKFCYLLYCLKQRGIYYTFPLNGNTAWGTVIIHDPEIPEFDGKIKMTVLEGLTPISEVAARWLKDFSKNLLTHVNPYTGIMIKDDPALISVEIQNENSPYMIFLHYPDLLDVYKRKCAERLLDKNQKAPSDEDVKAYLPRFIIEAQQKDSREFITFLRELGVTKPLTGVSCGSQMPLELTRELFDYVDDHTYWDLAEGLPAFPHLRNPLKNKWVQQLGAGSCRLFGKPFAVGEYNTVYPSPYWAYMGPSISAIAGLQNWDMIIGCALNSFVKQTFNPAPAMGIKSFNPMILMTERIGTILYKNDLVKASEIKIPYVFTREYIYKRLNVKGGCYYPSNYSVLGLCCQVGSVIYDEGTDLSAYPRVVVPQDMVIPASMKNVNYVKADANLHHNLKDILPGLGKDVFTSTMGQTTLDHAKKTFSVMTSGAECFMLPADQAGVNGKNVMISRNSDISTSFVGALDNQPIETSKRLLALYVTDLKNTGTVVEYYDAGGAAFRVVGTTPFLLKQGEALFTIKTRNPELPDVWALRYDGSRQCLIPARKTLDGFAFTARAVTAKDAYFAYEIVWK